MALTATASQGFEATKRTSGEEIYYVLGDPGVTFTRGDRVAMAGGVLIKATNSLANTIGVVARTTICPAASQAAARAFEFRTWDQSAAKHLCLVPVRLDIGPGAQIFSTSFAGHSDNTVVSYSAASRYIELGTALGADDDSIGAYVYVYDGTGAGQVGIVEDYDETGGTVEGMLVLHRPFAVDLDTTSKIIILEGAGSGAVGIGQFGRIDGADADNLDTTDGSDDGDYIVFMDWKETPDLLANLKLKVVAANRFYA